jgi:hypothetical protein
MANNKTVYIPGQADAQQQQRFKQPNLNQNGKLNPSGKDLKEGCPFLGSKYRDLVAAAEKDYPKKAGKFENHHIVPKYLGGDEDGPTVRLPSAYHQYITNEFRSAWPYGRSQPGPNELDDIMNRVYSKYPLPR